MRWLRGWGRPWTASLWNRVSPWHRAEIDAALRRHPASSPGRCPSRHPGDGTLRCWLDRDHGSAVHQNATWIWKEEGDK